MAKMNREQASINSLLDALANMAAGGESAAGSGAAAGAGMGEVTAVGDPRMMGYTGRPVRPEVLAAARADMRGKAGGRKPRVRVMGGLGKDIEGKTPGTVDKLLKKLGTTRKEAGRLGKEAVGFALLQGIMSTALQGGQMVAQSSLENADIDAQMAGLSPEAVKESALQPVTRAQRDFALQMLMQQLNGGRGTRTQLARGEVLT